jgi:hypothetical protein
MKKAIVIFFIVNLYGCGGKYNLDKKDYLAWIESEESGLTKHHLEKNLDFTAIYCTKDYLIAKEMKVEDVKEENFKRREKDFEGFEYFKVRIKRTDSNQEVLMHGLSDENQYLERVNYMSYGFDENLCLVRNNFKDTIYPALYHFERTYGVVPYADLIVSFKSDSSLKDTNYKLVINDNVFGNGLIVYDFDKRKLNEAVKLKLY